jgi:hypothetical protein
VSQISPPIRILAVVAVAFIAIYMVALRPKSSTPAPTAAAPTPAGNVHTGKPAVTQFGKAVQEAQGAAKATEKQMQGEAHSAGEPAKSTSAVKSGSSSATRSSSSPSATAAAAAPAVDVKGLPRPVAKAVRQNKVMALLFWNGRSADDHAVRAAFRHIETFHGAVYTRVAPLGAIAHYGRITRGADVQQSPTVVVVDRNLKATTLVGYTDADTMNQAVVDALRASGGIFTDAYLKRVNKMCSSVAHDIYAVPQPTSIPQARQYLGRASGRLDRFTHGLRALPAPAKWHAFKRGTLADLGQVSAAYRGLRHDLAGHPNLQTVVGSFTSAGTSVGAAGKRFNRRMDRAGLIFCGSSN